MKLFNGMPMHYGAKPELFRFAKKMRYEPTQAERLLWELLTADDLKEYKFRRQHPISSFIADFYSHSLLLVIEVDGGYHLTAEQKEVDQLRDEDMQALGLFIIRFTNDEVLSEPKASIERLKLTIAQLKTY